jgi:glucans biosynthesis protein C
MNAVTIDAAPRRYDIDQLRNTAVLLLIVFHSARLFDAEAWHIKDAGRYLAADVVVRFLNQWQMALLFLLAGMSICLALQGLNGKTLPGFARERVSRLLVPLLAGCVLFVLPQVWVERSAIGAPGRSSPIDFHGSLLEFIPRFFDCCYPQANFSWHHLWFLAYLFSYSVALLPLLALARRPAVARVLERSADAMDTLPRLLRLGVPLLVIEALLRPSFPSTHDLTHDWANHAHYVYLIVLGAWLARSVRAQAAALRHWRSLLAAALCGSALWLSAPLWSAALDPNLRRPAWLLLRIGGEWLWLLALLGVARRFLAAPTRLTRFTRHAMPFYVVHQTLIVGLGGWWLAWSDAPLLKYFAVAGVSAIASWLLCLLADRFALTRWLVGLKAPPGRRTPILGHRLSEPRAGGPA